MGIFDRLDITPETVKKDLEQPTPNPPPVATRPKNPQPVPAMHRSTPAQVSDHAIDLGRLKGIIELCKEKNYDLQTYLELKILDTDFFDV